LASLLATTAVEGPHIRDPAMLYSLRAPIWLWIFVAVNYRYICTYFIIWSILICISSSYVDYFWSYQYFGFYLLSLYITLFTCYRILYFACNFGYINVTWLKLGELTDFLVIYISSEFHAYIAYTIQTVPFLLFFQRSFCGVLYIVLFGDFPYYVTLHLKCQDLLTLDVIYKLPKH
jgi:hypothetical protein